MFLWVSRRVEVVDDVRRTRWWLQDARWSLQRNYYGAEISVEIDDRLADIGAGSVIYDIPFMDAHKSRNMKLALRCWKCRTLRQSNRIVTLILSMRTIYLSAASGSHLLLHTAVRPSNIFLRTNPGLPYIVQHERPAEELPKSTSESSSRQSRSFPMLPIKGEVPDPPQRSSCS